MKPIHFLLLAQCALLLFMAARVVAIEGRSAEHAARLMTLETLISTPGRQATVESARAGTEPASQNGTTRRATANSLARIEPAKPINQAPRRAVVADAANTTVARASALTAPAYGAEEAGEIREVLRTELAEYLSRGSISQTELAEYRKKLILLPIAARHQAQSELNAALRNGDLERTP